MSRERTEKPVSPSTPTHVEKRKVNLGDTHKECVLRQ